jgi:hypothetical protein
MGRRPRVDGRAGRGGARGHAVAGPPPPVLEVPEQIPDLAAWYDSRTDDYLALDGPNITAWMSRAGSMGAMPLSQGVAANQPLRLLGALPGGKNTVRLDGVAHFLQALLASDWIFTHDGSGYTAITVEKMDSTGLLTQAVLTSAANGAGNTGLFQHIVPTDFLTRVSNGSGTGYVNIWDITAASFTARDVLRWRATSHGGGFQRAHVSGLSLSNPDVGGQVPSTAPAGWPLRVGRSTSASISLKGDLPQIVFYKRVLSDAEIASVASFLATQYGVAA